jgi:hypothetical protein
MQNMRNTDAPGEAGADNTNGDNQSTKDNVLVSTTQTNSSLNGPLDHSSSRELTGWNGLQFHQDTDSEPEIKISFAHLRDVILLDKGSNLKSTFMNPEMVTDIKVSESPISILTNTGGNLIGLEASVPGNGPTWYDPNQMANFYGFSHMVDKYRITYNSNKEDAFLVHADKGIIKFPRTHDGLYAYRAVIQV